MVSQASSHHVPVGVRTASKPARSAAPRHQRQVLEVRGPVAAVGAEPGHVAAVTAGGQEPVDGGALAQFFSEWTRASSLGLLSWVRVTRVSLAFILQLDATVW